MQFNLVLLGCPLHPGDWPTRPPQSAKLPQVPVRRARPSYKARLIARAAVTGRGPRRAAPTRSYEGRPRGEPAAGVHDYRRGPERGPLPEPTAGVRGAVRPTAGTRRPTAALRLSPAAAALVRSDEEPVLADGALGGVVVDLDAAVIEVGRQARPHAGAEGSGPRGCQLPRARPWARAIKGAVPRSTSRWNASSARDRFSLASSAAVRLVSWGSYFGMVHLLCEEMGLGQPSRDARLSRRPVDLVGDAPERSALCRAPGFPRAAGAGMGA